jgi:hypothetical protein
MMGGCGRGVSVNQDVIVGLTAQTTKARWWTFWGTAASAAALVLLALTNCSRYRA